MTERSRGSEAMSIVGREREGAQGATLQELADSYDRSISTMRRATRAA